MPSTHATNVNTIEVAAALMIFAVGRNWRISSGSAGESYMTKKCAFIGAMIGFFVATASAANATEIKVIGSASFKPAYNEIVSAFEKATTNNVITSWSSTVEIPKRNTV